jgi:hypothetical protein
VMYVRAESKAIWCGPLPMSSDFTTPRRG